MIHWRWCWDCLHMVLRQIFGHCRTLWGLIIQFVSVRFRNDVIDLHCSRDSMSSFVQCTKWCEATINYSIKQKASSAAIGFICCILRRPISFGDFFGPRINAVILYVMWLRSAIINHATRTIWTFCSHLISSWLQQKPFTRLLRLAVIISSFFFDGPQRRFCAWNRTPLAHFIIQLHAACLRRVQNLQSNHYFAFSIWRVVHFLFSLALHRFPFEMNLFHFSGSG